MGKVTNPSKTNLQKLCLLCSLFPNGKPTSCSEDFRKCTVKELQGILKHYHESIREKSRPSDENLCHFLSFPTKVTVSAVAIWFVYESYYLLHLKSCFFSLTLKWNVEKCFSLIHENTVLMSSRASLSSWGQQGFPQVLRTWGGGSSKLGWGGLSQYMGGAWGA